MDTIIQVISLLLLIYHLQSVNSFGGVFDTDFNRLTKILLEETTDIDEKLKSTETHYIEQPVDHFGENSQTWKMRYFEDLSYFQTNGPIYVFIGGEAEANPLFLSAGVINELAQETGGAMFMSEHRYYGQSQPFSDSNTENMKWLSSKQALGDVAELIKHIKSDPKFTQSKVVVIGGSYAGNLAAWMRLKYPQLVDAAISSSGPVLAKKDFYEYLEKVNEDYGRYGASNCLTKIRSTFKRYKDLLSSSQGIEQLKQEQNICDECDLGDSKNQCTFFMMNITPFMMQSQYGGPGKITEHCSSLGGNVKKSIHSKIRNRNLNQCNDVSFNSFTNFIKQNNDMHSWFYQVCTEFAYFQTTSSANQPFGDVVSKDCYLEICKNVFGPTFDESRVDEGVSKSNEDYGGKTPQVTHVVFANGDVDPWSTISVLENLSSEAPAIVIPRSTHCADLMVRSDSSEELRQASMQIKRYIKQWIGA